VKETNNSKCFVNQLKHKPVVDEPDGDVIKNLSDNDLQTWIGQKSVKLESGGVDMLGDQIAATFESNPSYWIGDFEYARLSDEGIRLHTGELITEGRVLDTLRKAVRLLDAGNKIGFCEMMDIDKYKKEGWDEDEIHTLVCTYLEDGRDLGGLVVDISNDEEFSAYFESKESKNNQ